MKATKDQRVSVSSSAMFNLEHKSKPYYEVSIAMTKETHEAFAITATDEKEINVEVRDGCWERLKKCCSRR